MLIPLKDENPLRFIGVAYVTIALIAACVLTYLWQVSLGPAQNQMILALGAVPAVITGDRALPASVAVVPAQLTLVTSMFLHGGWLHLGGNMLFCGSSATTSRMRWGHIRFIVFYLLCGIAAALAHVAVDPGSQIPTIGASGAISGVLGGYLVLHPRAQVLTLFLRFFITLPAFVVLGLWFALQAVSATVATGGEGGGVAWWAHIGGFIAGVALVIPFRRRAVPLLERDGAPPLPAREVIHRLKSGSVPVTRRR
ncbi:MAG: rhomboid family intramembrane serine protease [Rhodospirillales bacterium]|nr:rhomboid family intramembrane serine protease [Rhodospirillales bacterium]